MRLLLDTHTLIWAMGSGRELPVPARRLIEDPRNDLYFSAINIIEIALKRATRKRSAPSLGPDDVWRLAIEAELSEVVVTHEHAIAVETIAIAHGDPFDRLLLAQAKVEGLQLLTHDERLARYDDQAIVF